MLFSEYLDHCVRLEALEGASIMYYDVTESGKRISRLRKERGMTQEQLALELNISVETIGKIERGKRGISVDMLVLLANYFHTSTDYLTGGDDCDDLSGLLTVIPEDKKELAVKMCRAVLETLVE